MLLEILLVLVVGVFAGTITGLVPGIHINLIGVLLISLTSSIFSSINSIYLAVFIVAMAITHTFIDFIPSIFLGCPDTDTELSVLPGHELLKQGKGYEAIILTTYGSLAAIFLLILIAFPSIIAIPKIYGFIENTIPYILIVIMLVLIMLENRKIAATFVLTLTGVLGLFVLNAPINEPLLPLLTGLFGSSMLIVSIQNKVQIPKQEIKMPYINRKRFLRPLMGSLIASPLCSFLPGLGSGQAAVIGNTISKSGQKEFLILLGATNTLVMGFSFISLYIIAKTRTGAAVALQNILSKVSTPLMILILTISLISGFIAFILTIKLSEFFSQKIEKINYVSVSLITLGILSVIVFLVSNFLGILVLVASTLTGIYCFSLGVKRTNMMGCLLIPTIFLYLF